MKRSSLRRRSRMRQRGQSRHATRTRSWDYMAWIRACRCRVAVALQAVAACAGRIHAHHAGERAFGRKADDMTCIPLCAAHHREWHDCAGHFAGWGKPERRTWADEQIAEMNAAWLALQGGY